MVSSVLAFAVLLLSVSVAPSQAQPTDSSAPDSLYPAKKDGRWGYVDRQGEWRIEPRFNYAKPFFEGRAAVNVIPPTTFDDKKSRWGIIDTSGEYVVEPRYAPTMTARVPSSPFGHYSEGRIPVDVSQTFASYEHEDRAEVFYLDRSGEKVFPDEFDKVGQYSDGLAPVLDGERVGYIDRDGRVVIPPRYQEGLLYSDGLIAVQDTGGDFGGPWKYVNEKGETVLRGPYDEAGSFFHGRAKVETESGVHYINTDGDSVFAGAFMGLNTSFRGGRAIVTLPSEGMEETHAIVDEDGRIVFPLGRLEGTLCGAEPFHDGLAQLVFVSSPNSVCSLSTNRPTSEGMADVVAGGEGHTYGYIDRSGTLVYRAEDAEAKVMASLPAEDREALKSLYEKSKAAFESGNWEEYLSYYAEDARAALIEEYIQALSMGIGFGGALAQKEEGKEKVEKLAREWKKLLREYGLLGKGGAGDEPSAKKIGGWPLSRKAGFYGEMIDLFREQGKEARPNFGTLVDIKAEGDKGAILLERTDDDGDAEKESRTVVRREGRWMWSEPFAL